MVTLPTNKIPAISEDPRYLILYGLPERFGPLRSDSHRKNI